MCSSRTCTSVGPLKWRKCSRAAISNQHMYIPPLHPAPPPGLLQEVTVNRPYLTTCFSHPPSEAALYHPKSCPAPPQPRHTVMTAGSEGICNKLSGCQFVPLMKECMPKEFDSKSLADLQALTKSFNAVNTTLWGECEGACYVRQVQELLRCLLFV